MTWKGPVIIPVGTLRAAGPNNQMILDLPFPDCPVIFSLGQGNGTVHIIGNHLIGTSIEAFDDMDEVIDEMDEDEEGEEGTEEYEEKMNQKVKKSQQLITQNAKLKFIFVPSGQFSNFRSTEEEKAQHSSSRLCLLSPFNAARSNDGVCAATQRGDADG
ncbi:hypothetical protein WA026_003986 [Henosepilachna vigintioctopunctata]|uniref:Nucleoplasmin core domain-containing protein n=1 Tax=Henosepilachna vigintioctopunctata TaxID=420089 RepID=A0AAW1UG72_9CUCU